MKTKENKAIIDGLSLLNLIVSICFGLYKNCKNNFVGESDNHYSLIFMKWF